MDASNQVADLVNKLNEIGQSENLIGTYALLLSGKHTVKEGVAYLVSQLDKEVDVQEHDGDPALISAIKKLICTYSLMLPAMRDCYDRYGALMPFCSGTVSLEDEAQRLKVCTDTLPATMSFAQCGFANDKLLPAIKSTLEIEQAVLTEMITKIREHVDGDATTT